MNLELTAFLNRPYFPKLLSAFFGALLLLALIQAKSSLWPTLPVSMAVSSTNQVEPNLQKSLAIPLFGNYVAINPNGAIKQSMLDVDVIGIMYATHAADSHVLIRLNNGEERSYFVGEELPGGAIIKRITANSVVILYQGALEVLNLPKNTLRFEKPGKPLF